MTQTYNPLEGERPELKFKLQDRTFEERVSIIIVHRDRPEFLNLTLQSICITSLHNNFELIVVDNGSEKRSQSFLDDIEKDGVKVIRNPENVWWSKAANQGVKAASKDSKYYVFMHHDIVVLTPNWLDLMINVSEANKCGIVGTKFRHYELDNQRVPFIHESCMLVTKECWESVGPFTEELPQEGSAFLLTMAANTYGYNPQAIDSKQMPLVHHYGIFALDFNEFERFGERARTVLPKLLAQVNAKYNADH